MPKKKQVGLNRTSVSAANGGEPSTSSSSSLPLLLQKCPLASAILDRDVESIRSLLEESLPKNGVTVQDLNLKKYVGEPFTGGRSTPVYSITATIFRPKDGRSITRHFIVKLVLMEDDNIDDNSKVQQLRESYVIERRFYDTVGLMLRQQEQNMTIPKVLYSDLDGSKPWPIFCILMTDVTTTHPKHPITLSQNQAKAALKWIANFHAFLWGSQISTSQKEWRLWDRGGFWTKSSGTSRIGTNWLKTMKYIEAKQSDALLLGNLRSFGKRLQNAGQPIHHFLHRLSTTKRYGTVIHGDYKAANMFLSANDPKEENDAGDGDGDGDDEAPSSASVAVVDFQYTGGGVCSDDVAYLLYPDARGYFTEEQRDKLLELYHSELIEQLMLHAKGGPSTISLDTFQILFRLSQLEMTRHWLQKGWAASTTAEVDLMLELDTFLTNYLDQGKVAEQDDYAAKLSDLVPM